MNVILKKSHSFTHLEKIFHLHPNSLNHLRDAKCIKVLGKGTFGDVKLYKCVECEGCNEKGQKNICNKYFVVKKIKCKQHLYNNKFIKKCLINEYTISTLLEHPNIRKTLDIDLIGNCLIFEYFNGIDFLEYLNLGDCNINDELKYYEQFIDAVEYMHNIGIAHMDLKLENIMLNTDNKTIKIIDFGESKVFHDTTHIDIVIKYHGIHGSEPYIAPEEFIQYYYDPEKVDVWSSAIILYEILYISIPWKKACISDFRFNTFVKYYPDIKLLSNTFLKENKENIADNILIKMLNPDPEKRCKIKDVKKDILKLKYMF